MNGSPLRYRIKYLLAACTQKERVAIKGAVIDKTGISDSSFSRYINLRKADKMDMPVFVLRAFTEVLGTTMEDLFVE